MKAVANFLNRTPWWALLAGGLALFIGLALFTTPFHLIRLEKSGSTPEENRAIKSEINSAFSESAINMARGVVKEMIQHTRDPARKEELERALEEIDQARDQIKEAGEEVMRAKRQAAEDVTGAVKDVTRAITEAQREVERALQDAGVEREKIQKSLDASLKAAKEAQAEARRAAKEAIKEGEQAAQPGAKKPRIVVMGPDGKEPIIDIDVGTGSASIGGGDPLSPEARKQIREKVTGDMYRVGMGTGLILIFIPLFILTIVLKFFIDRSRAATHFAELKKKEADFSRMSQQVTEAKLSALQAQVEPHFLYNTLASVQALTEVDPAQANAMTGHLIQYLRNALPKMRENVSTVGQEIELVRAYLNILQMRMGKRLAFEIDVPAELMEAPFPPLMLPSLVENSIKHGLEPQREGGKITISASAEGGQLSMKVADTGRGFGESIGAGVGLTNIRERLAALYGANAKLTLVANEPQGVVATIEVPRVGARARAGIEATPAPMPSEPPPIPAAPRTAAMKTLAVMGTAERAWRKSLSFAFIVLVVVAAVFAGLGMVGVATGLLPVSIADDSVGGPTGALIGTVAVLAAFVIVVLALAVVLAVVYGLGFLFVGIAIFVPLVILVALFPVLAPFILLALGLWWLARRISRKPEEPKPPAPPAPNPETSAS
jgi:histidine kinase/histidine kinase/DNA gyrase B/HSP90-like ATPase